MTSGWESVALGEVVKPTERREAAISGKAYRQVGVKLWGLGAYERETIDGSATKYPTLARVETNDLVVNKIWARNGSVAVITSQLAGAWVSNEFPTFAPLEHRVLPRWLHWITKSKWFWDACNSQSQGTSGQNRIRPEKFLEIPIPLPPLEEQRRIVARVEALAARIEEARGLRKSVTQESRFFDAGITSQLFDNPDWTRKSVDHLCDVRSGVQKSANRLPGANPRRYVTVAHVQRNRISTDDPRFFEVSPEEFERWKLLRGDVLVVEGNGNIEHVGRSALFSGEIENCIHQNHVIRVRPNQTFLLPEFLNAFFNSPVGRSQMLERSRTTSGLYTLSTGRIREIMIPLPSLETQRTIMETLDDHRQRLATLERLQTSTRLELDALLPSVLAKAFAGEL